jgi:hypothetical protein
LADAADANVRETDRGPRQRRKIYPNSRILAISHLWEARRCLTRVRAVLRRQNSVGRPAFNSRAAVSFGKRKSPAEPEPSSGASRTGNLCLQRFWKPLPRPLDPITQGASGEFRSAVFGRGTSIKPVFAASKRLCCRQPLVRAPPSRAVMAVPRQAHPAVGRHALRVVRCCGSMCDAIMGG